MNEVVSIGGTRTVGFGIAFDVVSKKLDEAIPARGGWRTPSRELLPEWRKWQKREPTTAESDILRRLAKRNNDIFLRPNIISGHPSRTDEMDFNGAQGLINFYIVHGRGPDGKDPVAPPRGGPEIEALVHAAVNAVPDGKSFWDVVTSVVTAPVRAVEHAASAVEHEVEKIPVVGDVTHVLAEIYTAPVRIVNNIASGARLDHVALAALKDQLKIAKDVAPYAQTVVALVPGVGTGVAAAIAAGAALAEGQNITEIGKAAIRGAIPGGAVAVAAFDVAIKAASGENITQAALEAARSAIPPGAAQKAFDIGLAVATGQKLQTVITSGLVSLAPGQLNTLISAGEKALTSTPALSKALSTVTSAAGTQGFKLAAGLLSQTGMSEKALTAVRSKLPTDVRQGFDTALKTQEGRVTWLKNVMSAPVSTAAAATRAPTVLEPPKKTPVTRAPTVLEPPKKAAPATQAPKMLEPPKVVATVAPKVLEPPKKAKPAPGAPAQIAGRYGPYPKMAASGLGAPPHHGGHPHGDGHPGGHGGGHPRIFRGGRGVPGWSLPAEVITTTETCRTWGDLVPIPPSMVQAVKTAIGSSGGRPTTMRGDDGTLYLFTVEGGGIAARPCTSVGVGDWSQWKRAANDAWNEWSSDVVDLWRGD